MKAFFPSVYSWLRSWDLMAIVYSIIGSLIFYLILRWTGATRKIQELFKIRKGFQSYRNDIRDFCSTLVVIGQRKGFITKDVFIPLDIAPSELADQQETRKEYEPTKFVLLGGPGAGKSTYVKKLLLDSIQRGLTPILIRLRDYVGFDSIENYLIKKLEIHGIPYASIQLSHLLSNPQCLCVLDGLDEVRPKDREHVSEHINKFYSTFFSNHHGRIIVTCRKEAYRTIPLMLPDIWEVRPLTNEQIHRFAGKWPPGYPKGKSAVSFCRDLFSTAKIVELVRSPLLLVGGLMQYTESNLGIPEERYEYLARIARWLISDWSIAQELPPDPLRNTYDRIIPRIAYHMHASQVSECDIQLIEKFIADWLPDYGHSASEAQQVLEGILTRTGILVRDTSGAIVFSQLSLQEYFASTRLISTIGIDRISTLAPLSWWREAILLAIAQEKEPSFILDRLFAENPLLAAAAVGECPTPSLQAQEKACSIAVEIIDKQSEGSAASIVPLLRKIAPALEESLCTTLETRLIAGAPISLTVANILATSGTQAATETLARHPEVWDNVLKSTSYLSASFENLLVGLIKQGTESQSDKAIELISQRLSKDRFKELVALLPSLSDHKQNQLSIYLLKAVENSLSPWFSELDRQKYSDISNCVAFIKDSSKYMSMYKTEDVRSRSPLSISPVPACLHIGSSKIRTSTKRLSSLISNSLAWSRQMPVIFSWIASCISILALLLPSPVRSILLCISLTAFLFGALAPSGLPPWLVGARFRGFSRQISALCYLIIGISFHNSLIGFLSDGLPPDYSTISILLLSLLFLVGGLSTSNQRWYYGLRNLLPGIGSFRRWVFLSWLIFLALLFIDHFFLDNFLILNSIKKYVSTLYISWIAIESTRLYSSWLHIRRGALTAVKKYPAFESNIFLTM